MTAVEPAHTRMQPGLLQGGKDISDHIRKREDLVAPAMGDEDALRPVGMRRNCEIAGRKRDNAPEQLRVGWTDREAIACAVGKSDQDAPPRIDGNLGE